MDNIDTTKDHMENTNTVLLWLQSWLQGQNKNECKSPCGVEIETVGELGWYITVRVAGTPYEAMVVPVVSAERSDTDWYYYRMYNAKFEASGDPAKLEFLLGQFKRIVEQGAVCS
jgi:hypothetical protein